MEEEVREAVEAVKTNAMAELYGAMSAFQGELVQPDKNKSVSVATRGSGTYRFKYADLGNCIKAAKPGLAKNGLSVMQVVQGGELVTVLAHRSGASITSSLPINVNQQPQALGSLLTYLKRYAYCAILGIVADDDDDANLAMGNRAEVAESRPRVATLAQKLAEVKADPDTNPEVIPVLEQVLKAGTKEELKAIFDAHAELQGTKLFHGFLTARRKELGL